MLPYLLFVVVFLAAASMVQQERQTRDVSWTRRGTILLTGCPLPEGRYFTPNNVKASPGELVKRSTTIYYYCQEYPDIAGARSVCLENNTWSTPQVCKRPCSFSPDPVDVVNYCFFERPTFQISIPCVSTMPSESSVIARCKAGFSGGVGQKWRLCMDGRWNGAALRCKADQGATTNVTPPTNVSNNSAPVEGCRLPDFPYDGRYTVSNYRDKQIVPGDVVSRYTILSYTCKNDFDVTSPLSVCQENSTWSNSVECNRRCAMPTSFSVDFRCYSSAGPIPCSPTLPSGSTVHSTCKEGHVSQGDLWVPTCRGGSWDKTAPECVPDCGLEKAFSQQHIVRGTTVKKDTFPWHVAIFQDMGLPVPDQICSGSLVRAHLVISAAHCFYDPINSIQIDARFYKAACGKFYRSWNSEIDDRLSFVQKTEVKRLILHEAYRGDEQNQANDVAVVELATPFKLSDSVRPVCMDLNGEEFNKIQVGPGKLGKVAGWGATEMGQPSEELKSLELPVIEFNDCLLEMTKYRFRRYLTRDKLCAGYTNGSALCQGDSGGGLVFPAEDYTLKTRWYLRGVVSNGPLNEEMTTCRANTYTAFTEIFKLRHWLNPLLPRLSY